MLKNGLVQARARSDELFRLVRPAAIYERPVQERHRLIFYLGHLEAFDWNLIGGVLSLPAFHAEFDRLFAFGIDPAPGQLPSDRPSDWPSIEEIQRYNRRGRQSIDRVLGEAPEDILQVAIEHRLMHVETFAYLLHNLPLNQKVAPVLQRPQAGIAPARRMSEVPGGPVTLGQCRGEGFGWDNEFNGHSAEVPAFAMDKYKITNADYLAFVRAGGTPPPFWDQRNNGWFLRTMFEELPLPMDWPVYVTYEDAQAYATWVGKTLPTEVQFHRAAYGTPNGDERFFPWGDAQPDASRGNFDFHRWDPIPVSASPAGDSAFGVSQLLGNGWEWTSTAFHPFPGFQPFPFYPGYSAPFFGNDHYVLKGGSARTAACLLRRSFRNWFRPNYRYLYASFRCVEN